MVYFTVIRPARNYLEYHAKDVPWDKVVEKLLKTKNPKEIGKKFVINKFGYYILFIIEKDLIFVINTKLEK